MSVFVAFQTQGPDVLHKTTLNHHIRPDIVSYTTYMSCCVLSLKKFFVYLGLQSRHIFEIVGTVMRIMIVPS